MYEKILVALDRSTIAEKVFETAIYLGKSFNAQVNLINVISLETINTTVGYSSFNLGDEVEMLEDVQNYSTRMVQESSETLLFLEKKAKEQEVDVIHTQIYGDPAKAICQQAKEWQADLIVMGRRGHSTVSELFLGSVSSSVIHRCHCAVHLVQI